MMAGPRFGGDGQRTSSSATSTRLLQRVDHEHAGMRQRACASPRSRRSWRRCGSAPRPSPRALRPGCIIDDAACRASRARRASARKRCGIAELLDHQDDDVGCRIVDQKFEEILEAVHRLVAGRDREREIDARAHRARRERRSPWRRSATPCRSLGGRRAAAADPSCRR